MECLNLGETLLPGTCGISIVRYAAYPPPACCLGFTNRSKYWNIYYAGLETDFRIIGYQGDLNAEGLAMALKQDKVEAAIHQLAAGRPDQCYTPGLTPSHLIFDRYGVIVWFKLDYLSFHRILFKKVWFQRL
jgi:hypothetical protein